MERSATGRRSARTVEDRAAGSALPRQGRRALDHAVFAVAVVPADLDRLRTVVATEVAALVPRAIAALEPADSAKGQELLRATATEPDPLHVVLPVRADGMVVGVLAVRTQRPLTGSEDDAVRRLGEVIGRRIVDAVHGTPQERATVEALRTREHQLLAAQRMASITVWHWNVRENTIDWLDADGRDLGLDGLGKTQEDYLAGIHPDDVEEHNRKLLGLLAAPGSVEVELRYRWESGWRNWYLWAESVADETGVVQSLWGTTQDVTAQRAAEAAIRRLAVTDSLTGLANRASLQDHLERALDTGSGECALLLLDLDRFKVVNDTLGHLVGDQLLVELGSRLATFARDGLAVGRLGGDEFLVVLPGGSLTTAQALAERVMTAVSAPIRVRGHAALLATRASIGIAATRQRPDITASDLYREADIALYAAKDAGRGRCAAYDDELDLRNGERQSIEAYLRAALLSEGVLPLYQPIIGLGGSAAEDRLVGCEALARLGHDLTAPGPVAFVPVAEETGLIADLDEAVFVRAAHDLLLPDRARGGGLSVAVNLSPRSLQVPGLADRLAATLESLGLDGARLRIEITESSLAEPTPTLLGALADLRGLGAGVGIDDFGTGYSALSYLQRFDLEFLKVDRSFVARVTHDVKARAVIRALVDLAHAHDLAVVAEGVETAEQLEIIRELGCDKAQGFLLGRPMPAAQLLARGPLAAAYTH
jgi:diguanylate cyclase (GGDEF)-like protein